MTACRASSAKQIFFPSFLKKIHFYLCKCGWKRICLIFWWSVLSLAKTQPTSLTIPRNVWSTTSWDCLWFLPASQSILHTAIQLKHVKPLLNPIMPPPCSINDSQWSTSEILTLQPAFQNEPPSDSHICFRKFSCYSLSPSPPDDQANLPASSQVLSFLAWEQLCTWLHPPLFSSHISEPCGPLRSTVGRLFPSTWNFPDF